MAAASLDICGSSCCFDAADSADPPVVTVAGMQKLRQIVDGEGKPCLAGQKNPSGATKRVKFADLRAAVRDETKQTVSWRCAAI